MAKSKTLAPAAIAQLLKKAQKQGFLADILAQVELASAQEKKGNNIEVRKAAILKALSTKNDLALAEITEAYNEHLNLSDEVAEFAPEAGEVGLNADQAVSAMRLLLAGKVVSESERAVYELVRNLVFATLDIGFADEESPENTNGFLDVPELGKRFCREMAGRKDPKIDFDALRVLVGDEVFEMVTVEKVTVTREINDAALAKFGLANPAVLEGLRDIVQPGDWKTPRLMVRDIPANEKE